MTLKELLLAAPELQLELLNEKAAVDVPVSRIDISETPDISDYIDADAFLLTTAMVYREDQGKLKELLPKLRNAGVAGIAIKLGRFLDEISPAVLNEAERLSFPVYRIPRNKTLGMVSYVLQSALLGTETRQLYYALEIQKQLSAMLLAGAETGRLLERFSRLLKRNVLMFDYFFDFFAAGYSREDSLRLNGKNTEEIGGLLRKIQHETPVEGIEEFVLATRSGKIRCIVAPIEPGDGAPLFLAIPYVEPIPEPFSYFVTEQAVEVFAFSVHNSHQLTLQEWTAQEKAFLTLLRQTGEDALSPIQVKHILDAYSFLEKGPYQVVAVGYRHDEALKLPQQAHHYALVYNWLQKRLSGATEDYLLVPLISRQQYILLLRKTLPALPPLLRLTAERLREYLPLRLFYGVGNQADSLSALNLSHIGAVTALHDAMEQGDGTPIQFYRSEGVSELLQFVPKDHVRHFCSHVLGTLAYPQNEYDGELRRTLEAYLGCQSDITETARIMLVHRNTVKYRIEKLQGMLDGSLADPDFSLRLRLALHISSPGKTRFSS